MDKTQIRIIKTVVIQQVVELENIILQEQDTKENVKTIYNWIIEHSETKDKSISAQASIKTAIQRIKNHVGNTKEETMSKILEYAQAYYSFIIKD